MAKAGHNAPKKKAMLQALEKSLGVVTVAAREIGIDRHTHYRWLESDAKYKAAVDELSNVALDFAESRLLEAMKGLNVTAILGYLNNKGESRGYNAPTKSENRSTVDISLSDEIKDILKDI